MKVPVDWLRDYCNPPLDVAGIEDRLTMTGTKVEAVHYEGVGEPELFVVGRVLDARPHPDAERLRVCEVDLGPVRPEGPATIVCGAPNVLAGQSVAVARPGAVIADGTKLTRVRLRGVVSEGMILAEDELGIGADHAGIIVLDGLASAEALNPGEPLAQVLPLGTQVLELEVTPNRPDCLAIYGVARELHAATGAPLAPAPWREDAGSSGPVAGATVRVECPDLCPRFTARLYEAVRIGQSPPWLKARLSAAGQRPINNVVDITNYVMLATGQPLHAFDFDRVAGGRLTVRRARPDEPVQTLDGQTRRLDSEMVVIEDADGPTSIAGLMGGARSEVSDQTERVLLEVANWNGPNIHRTSRLLGLRSEASARFEKSLAPEACSYAQALASGLMVALADATLLPGTLDVAVPLQAPPLIRLRPSRVARVLGMEVAPERQVEILRALDFEVSGSPAPRAGLPQQDAWDPNAAERIPAAETGLEVTVPPLRREDVTREADLIEEIARIAGLEKLPATLPARRGAYGVLTPEQRLRRRVVDLLVGCGLDEVIGWTFSSPEVLDELRLAADDPRRCAVQLENPLSEDQSQLRTMLLGSLRTIAVYNAARELVDLGLFEIGTVFALEDARIAERRALGILMSGRTASSTWRLADPPKSDFFALKAVLEAFAGALGVGVECPAAAAGLHPFLHPARAAEVVVSGRAIGWLGELHPLVVAGELAGAPAMEVDLDALIGAAMTASRPYRDLISYPPLRRDVAVSLPEQVPAAEVLEAVRGAAGEWLEGARIFDVYSGPQVGVGRRSLAIALAFRDPERTLSEEDVEPIRGRIEAAVRQLGGELRG